MKKKDLKRRINILRAAVWEFSRANNLSQLTSELISKKDKIALAERCADAILAGTDALCKYGATKRGEACIAREIKKLRKDLALFVEQYAKTAE